jgi:hypothetical protein
MLVEEFRTDWITIRLVLRKMQELYFREKLGALYDEG